MNKSTSAPSAPKAHPGEEQIALGLRDRMLMALGRSPSEEVAAKLATAESHSLQPLFATIYSREGSEGESIKRALSSHRGISAKLNELLDPELSRDDTIELIRQLNDKYGLPPEDRHSRHFEAYFTLPRGAQLRVRLFPDKGDRLFFTVRLA